MSNSHTSFVGSIPETYHAHLGPLWFEPYARDLVGRLDLSSSPRQILELACGTGIVTRHLHERSGAGATIVATDLNESMLDAARRHLGQAPGITWQTADATQLPFSDQMFDAVVCQFGVMFFPDKPRAMREALRVLKPGGQFLFNVWDSLAVNPLPRLAQETVASFFDTNPPNFYSLVPFGFHDVTTIRSLLDAAGFQDVVIDTVALESSGPSAEHVAKGVVCGSPLLVGIQERGGDSDAISTAVAEKLESAFGNHPLHASMQAHVVTARRR
jgi:ubiquinone/menaquinone biosynthesis C-methylase UbiE